MPSLPCNVVSLKYDMARLERITIHDLESKRDKNEMRSFFVKIVVILPRFTTWSALQEAVKFVDKPKSRMLRVEVTKVLTHSSSASILQHEPAVPRPGGKLLHNSSRLFCVRQA
jgi:hypothetical protein